MHHCSKFQTILITFRAVTFKKPPRSSLKWYFLLGRTFERWKLENYKSDVSQPYLTYVLPQHLSFTEKWGRQGGIGMQGEWEEEAHTKKQKMIWNQQNLDSDITQKQFRKCYGDGIFLLPSIKQEINPPIQGYLSFFIKISGLVFYRNLAVLQLVDVPGIILNFVNICGRLFLIIRKSKGSLWCQRYFEKKIHTIVWEYWILKQWMMKLVLLMKAYGLSTFFLVKWSCHRESFECDLARGESENFFDKSLLYYINAANKLKTYFHSMPHCSSFITPERIKKPHIFCWLQGV